MKACALLNHGLFAVWLAACFAGPAGAQTGPVVNLDESPQFDFGSDPYADPLYAAQTLGLSPASPSFARVSALSALAVSAQEQFPPGREFFASVWGNPGAVVLGGSPSAAGLPAGDSPLSMAGHFRPIGTRAEIMPGRGGVASMTEGARVVVGGRTYEMEQSKVVSPLVLDLDRDGLLGASRGYWKPHPSRLTGPYAAFDIDGDGFTDVTEWIAPGDGLLCRSATPRSGRDLLGNTDGWSDGFARLAAEFDANHDGTISGAERNGLFVWCDDDGDAVPDELEVRTLTASGIAALSTSHTDFAGTFSDLAGQHTMWDWWPNFGLVNVRAPGLVTAPQPVAGGATALQPVLNASAADTFETLPATVHVSPAQMTAAGLTPGVFRLISVKGGGVIIGADETGSPKRARVWTKKLTAMNDGVPVLLPFADIFQAACDAAGRRMLILGERGARLAMADLISGTVLPPAGLDLKALKLRASGLAGCTAGRFWFSAWELDAAGRTKAHLIWSVMAQDFAPGLSLDGLGQSLGGLRSFVVTGPDSGFFAAARPENAGEKLWVVDGSSPPVPIAEADSFGAMAAVPGTVAFTSRTGSTWQFAIWRRGRGITVRETSGDPFLFPHLTDDGSAAVVVRMPAGATTLSWFRVAADGGNGLTPVFEAAPGQARACRGGFLHYGPGGIDFFPLAEAPPPFFTISRAPSADAGFEIRWPASHDQWLLEGNAGLDTDADGWQMPAGASAPLLRGMSMEFTLNPDAARRFFLRLRRP